MNVPRGISYHSIKQIRMHQYINLLPDKTNESIKKLVSKLGIEIEPMILDIIPGAGAEYGSCFVNVLNKVREENGEIIYGWQFCEYPYMIEAEFHAVWKSPNGQLIDITPSLSNENQILFVIDKSRVFQGESTDNFRFNTTTNELVDDIIRVEEARFRFMNAGQRKNMLGELPLNDNEASVWQAINLYSEVLEQMYFASCTIHSNCFCNSEISYSNCHRRILSQLLSTI